MMGLAVEPLRRQEGKKLQWTDGVEALIILTRLRLRTALTPRRAR